ncbi:MAG: arsenite methyltransferase [Bacteroidota bacterium]
METSGVKQAVVESYGNLAKEKKGSLLCNVFGCGDSGNHARQVGELIGYSQEELDAVPENANLGIGCGNPHALTKIQKGETVIDLGSGAGFDAFLVSRVVGEEGKVIGIDLADDMLALARTNAVNAQYTNTEFIKGDIENVPLENETADHVISNCVINLSQHKQQVFHEAYRVLKAGGRLSISDIVLKKELPWYIQNSVLGRIACVSGAEKLENYFTYLHEAGFHDIKVESKAVFPLELMMTDPHVKKLAKRMRFILNQKKIEEMASRVVSVSLTARK